MTCGSVSSQEKNKVKAGGGPGRSEKVERMGLRTLNNERQEWDYARRLSVIVTTGRRRRARPTQSVLRKCLEMMLETFLGLMTFDAVVASKDLCIVGTRVFLVLVASLLS